MMATLNIRSCKSREPLLRPRSEGGFTIIEVLFAVVVFSVGLVVMASVSLTVVGGNKNSRHFIEASICAQKGMEYLRYKGFVLGADALLGTADDTIPQELANANTGNDAVVDPATLFASPDHAYTATNAHCGMTSPILDSPAMATSKYLQYAWVVRDNVPAVGMKTVFMIIGWKEGTSDRYVVVTSAIQGT